jgi:ribonuclease P protein component
MAVLVSLRHGPSVQRNRIKRLCREAFRLCRPELPSGYDYIIRPQTGVEMVLEELQQSLRKLSRAATQERKP